MNQQFGFGIVLSPVGTDKSQFLRLESMSNKYQETEKETKSSLLAKDLSSCTATIFTYELHIGVMAVGHNQ